MWPKKTADKWGDPGKWINVTERAINESNTTEQVVNTAPNDNWCDPKKNAHNWGDPGKWINVTKRAINKSNTTEQVVNTAPNDNWCDPKKNADNWGDPGKVQGDQESHLEK